MQIGIPVFDAPPPPRPPDADIAGGIVFQIGANGGSDQRVTLFIENMGAEHIGIQGADGRVIEGQSVWDARINTIENANHAIRFFDGATNMVSAQRASLGAMQNRLEHTLNNLGVGKENLTAAESTIRDVDMAKEMMEFTKSSILMQSHRQCLHKQINCRRGFWR